MPVLPGASHFDPNDFDETLPGPFEWDVKRLVASLAVAGHLDAGAVYRFLRRLFTGYTQTLEQPPATG